MPLGCETQGKQKIFGFGNTAIFCLRYPLARGLVKMCSGDTGVKCAVLLDVQLLLYMIEVLSELVSSGVSAGPSPVLH